MSATLLDARSSRIHKIADLCRDADELRDLVNEAQRLIMKRGKWWGLYQKIRVCLTDSGCITWPRQVAMIENVAVDSYPVPVRNEWYEFLGDGPGLMPKRNPDCSSCAEEMCWGGPQLYDRGMAPSFNDFRPPNKKLRLYSSKNTDDGKRILVKGHDANGVWIKSDDGADYIEGFYMTLAYPFVDSPMEMRDMTSIQLPALDERLLAFELDTVNGGQRQIGDYEPDFATPSYRRSFISGMNGTSSCTRTVTAMVKLDFAPAVRDTDILMIGNLDAIKAMVQAILKREGNMESEAIALERAALRELNQELDHRNGKVQTAIGLHVYGTARLNRLRIGGMQ